jgi:hypothetical protein
LAQKVEFWRSYIDFLRTEKPVVPKPYFLQNKKKTNLIL